MFIAFCLCFISFFWQTYQSRKHQSLSQDFSLVFLSALLELLPGLMLEKGLELEKALEPQLEDSCQSSLSSYSSESPALVFSSKLPFSFPLSSPLTRSGLGIYFCCGSLLKNEVKGLRLSSHSCQLQGEPGKPEKVLYFKSFSLLKQILKVR